MIKDATLGKDTKCFRQAKKKKYMKNIHKVIRAVKTTSKKHGKNEINNGYKCNLKKKYEKKNAGKKLNQIMASSMYF